MNSRKKKTAVKGRKKKPSPLVAVPASVISVDACAPAAPILAPAETMRLTPKAPEILGAASNLINAYAAFRDKPSGERTMPRAVTAFNALTGQQLTEVQGWLFMALIKTARATSGPYDADNYIDLAGYSGLAGEAAARAAATTLA